MTQSDHNESDHKEQPLQAAVTALSAAVATTAGSLDPAIAASLTDDTIEPHETTNGKYLRVVVPNFNGVLLSEPAEQTDAANSAEPMDSYLRLGAVPRDLRLQISAFLNDAKAAEEAEGEQAPPVPDPADYFDPRSGEDLALRVRRFSSDEWRQCGAERAADELGSPPGYAPNYRTPQMREAASERLHLRGGWREHTDGNRISTTRGDKVEVIGGHYKLLVRCRDELGNMESGWDVSGGHVEGATSTLGSRRVRGGTGQAGARTEQAADSAEEETDVRWVERSHGVWQTVETAHKGDSQLLQHGDADTVLFGHVHKSSTGSVGATDWHEPEDCDKPDECVANPKVLDRTWAELIHSFTGSEALRVPLVQNTTHTVTTETRTHVNSMTDETHADSMTTHMTVDDTFEDSTTCDSSMTTMIHAGAYTDVTFCRRMDSTTNGNILDVTVAPLYLTMTVGPNDSDTIGAMANVLIGSSTDITLGASLSVSIGASLDVMVGASSTISAGAQVNLSLTHNEATAGIDAETATAHNVKALLVMLG